MALLKTLQKFELWLASGALLSVTALALSIQPVQLPQVIGEGTDPVGLVKDIAARYASLAIYDVNRDGQLDTAEQATLAQAVAEGLLPRTQPGRQPATDQMRSTNAAPNPTPAQIAALMAKFYASVAVYDVNRDGRLDRAEQVAVVQAITGGEIRPQQPDPPSENQSKKSEPVPRSPHSTPRLPRPGELLANGAAPDANYFGHPKNFATTFPGQRVPHS